MNDWGMPKAVRLVYVLVRRHKERREKGEADLQHCKATHNSDYAQVS
jgi:hypothetical protein